MGIIAGLAIGNLVSLLLAIACWTHQPLDLAAGTVVVAGTGEGIAIGYFACCTLLFAGNLLFDRLLDLLYYLLCAGSHLCFSMAFAGDTVIIAATVDILPSLGCLPTCIPLAIVVVVNFTNYLQILYKMFINLFINSYLTKAFIIDWISLFSFCFFSDSISSLDCHRSTFKHLNSVLGFFYFIK